MMISAKLSLSFIALTCLLQSNAFADQIYQLPISSETKVSALSLSALAEFNDAQIVDSIPQLGIVITKRSVNGASFMASGVKSLGPVGQVHLLTPVAAPAAPSSMWGLKAINVSKAWPTTQGAGVVVAISDTGVTSKHPDLAGQMWKNPGETGLDAKGKDKSSNGVDDDGDGYIDDVYGWNFVTGKPSGTDNHFHGTHVAGTIAARSSKSMVGIAPLAKVMDVSFLDKNGSGSNVNGAKTLVFAADHGAKIINCSWGGGGSDPALEQAIAYAEKKGVLVIVAAGNNTSDNDKVFAYPANDVSENILSVGATSDANGTRAVFSNYGQTTVELAAPGDNIRSLKPPATYQNLSGTSMATPHVTGVAALVLSAHPNYTYQQLKKALMATRPASSWRSKSITEGILDAELAITH